MGVGRGEVVEYWPGAARDEALLGSFEVAVSIERACAELSAKDGFWVDSRAGRGLGCVHTLWTGGGEKLTSCPFMLVIWES